MRDIYEYGDAAPVQTLFVIVGLSLALCVMAILTLLRAKQRAKVAAAEAASLRDPTAELKEGEVVLAGVVEHAAGHDVAVRVEIEQVGSESESSGSWSYTWTEVDRRTVVAPFYLKLADNTQPVRVEPPRDVEVADNLDGKVLISETLRKRTAELVPGEAVHAHGWLERGGDARPDTTAGYREVTWGWVLRPAHGRMMLSSFPLGDGLGQRAAFHRRYGVRAIALFVILQVALVGYYTRALGSVDEAVVLDHHHTQSTDSDGDVTNTYELTIAFKDGSQHTVEVGHSDWNGPKGERLPVRRGSLNWSLGLGPTLHWLQLGLMVALVMALLSMYKARRVASRPWYRRKVNDSGSGRLADSR